MFPILFTSEHLTLFSYPLFMGIAWGLAYHISHLFYLKKFNNTVHFNLFFWGNFVMSWLGAKLAFLMTYKKMGATELSQHLSFWFGGGFVFYGGLIAAFLFTAIFAWKIKKCSIGSFSFLVIPLSLGHAIGRLGCFLAGCCYGSEYNGICSVEMHQALRHPVQIYEAVALTLLFFWSKKKMRNLEAHPHLISQYLIFYSIIRFSLEFFRGDIVRGNWGIFSTSQWISLGIILLCLGFRFFYSGRIVKFR
ncbi:MAG: prolipoprotein diacylglyceryl transferase [Bacteriovoracaceae bacterium]|nr:prolipoprotein diacylglyceryl transferase [Bacteriovoracaceae bacterium]